MADAFAPPETRLPRADLRAARRFLIQRLLRVGANAAMFGLLGTLAWSGTRWLAFVVAAGLTVLLWLPTTGILFRVTFFPSPPDPRFVDADGDPISLEDVRWVTRAQVAEYLLGSAPMPLVLAWVSLRLEPVAQLVGFAAAALFAALVARRAAQAVGSLVLNEVATDLALGAPARARRWIEALARAPGRPRDQTLSLLARARFHTSDVSGALEALDRIRDPDRWSVGPLRAQMAIARGDLDEAEALSSSLRREDEGVSAVIEALVDLHRGRADAVVARSEALLALRARPEVRRNLGVLIAAALAPSEPDRARALLAEHGWTRDRLDWLRSVWPPVGRALERLDGW